MNERPRQSIIGVMDEKNNNLRYVTMIGHLPFYQSSGRNSGEKGTWFPFMGLQEKSMGAFVPKGMFLKPPLNIKENSPPELSQYLHKNEPLIGEIVQRFGNFEAMSISMLIGGSFWKSDEGIQLRGFILEHYKDDIRILYNHTKSIIENINELSGTEKIYSIKQPELVNRWLIDHGFNSAIDFLYTDLKITGYDLSMNSDINDSILYQIDNAINSIKNSATWYRTESKQQKINVLESGRKYVSGEITKDEFEYVINQNPDYKDSIGKSTTEDIVKNIFINVDQANLKKENLNINNISSLGNKKSS